MLNVISSAIQRELERHPVTLIAVTILAGFAFWSFTEFARAEDIARLQSRIDGVATQYQILEKSISRANLESQIENIDREIFSLKREIDRTEERGERVPDIYRHRISILETSKQSKLRELNRIDLSLSKSRRSS